MNVPAKSKPADRLRLCKALMEMTSSAMAEALHMSVSSVNGILSGRTPTDMGTAIHIGKTFGIDPKWILYGGTTLPPGVHDTTAEADLPDRWTVSVSSGGTSMPILLSVPAGTTKDRIRTVLRQSKTKLSKTTSGPSIESVVADACWLQPGWHWEEPAYGLTVNLDEA